MSLEKHLSKHGVNLNTVKASTEAARTGVLHRIINTALAMAELWLKTDT